MYRCSFDFYGAIYQTGGGHKLRPNVTVDMHRINLKKKKKKKESNSIIKP